MSDSFIDPPAALGGVGEKE